MVNGEQLSPLTVTPVADQAAPLDEEFVLQLQVTGGWAPYVWQVTGLPTGLKASADGLVSGVPTKVQTATVTCQVTDSYTPPITAETTFKIRVT